MKLQALSTLAAVVELGSFAAAADEVSITPSAVSLQMKQLEEYFQQRLFDRSGRSVRPTDFALDLARTVKRAVSEIEAMRGASPRAPAGRVRLGVTQSAQTTLFPLAFSDLRKRAPQIELVLQRGSTPGLLQALKAGSIDAAVLIRPQTGGSNRLVWTELLSEVFVLVVPADLEGTGVTQILRQQPWIRLDRELVAGSLAARFVNGILPNHHALVDVPSLDAILAMIATGIGVSVLPKLRPEQSAFFRVREIGLGRNAPLRRMVMVRRAADADNLRINVVVQAFQKAAQGK